MTQRSDGPGESLPTMVSIDLGTLTLDMVHCLRVVQGAAAGRVVPIGEKPLVVGRDPGQDLHVPDSEVSRTHCEVWLEGQAVRVRDLGSTNGTYVDGQLLGDSIALPIAGRLRVGKHVLRHDLLSTGEVERQLQLDDDLERARRYLAALFPQPLSTGPVRTFFYHVPSAGLGGDAYGHFTLDDGRLAFYVVDVAGHGVGSAMHSAAIVSSLRNGTLPDTDFAQPRAVLASLNAAFPMHQHNGLFCTLWYGVLDPQTGELHFGSAGHPPALQRAADGSIYQRLATQGPPIGAFAETEFDVSRTVLRPGDRLYIYSDGAYEITGPDGIAQSEDDLEQRVVDGPADDPACEPERLYRTACALHGGALPDDFTAMVVAFR